MSKSIIMNPGRVGGSLLVDALNSHSQLDFTGEILNLYTPSIPSRARKILEEICGPMPEHREKKNNQTIPVAYIQQLLEEYDGFKMLYYELNQGIISYVLNRSDVKLIHLKRWNALEHCVSQLAASRSRVYHIGPHKKTHTENLHIPIKSIGKYFKRYVNEQKRYDEMFQCMEIFYEDMIKDWDGTTAKIQRYIGVDIELLPITQGKVVQKPMQDVITNYAELHDHFKDTEYSCYFKTPILYL
jgi:hypothetical protein